MYIVLDLETYYFKMTIHVHDKQQVLSVHRWGSDGATDEAAKSIPYQLQRLFLLLQTSCKRSVETTDITRSFGWDSSEGRRHHYSSTALKR